MQGAGDILFVSHRSEPEILDLYQALQVLRHNKIFSSSWNMSLIIRFILGNLNATDFDFDAVSTPSCPVDVFVSPLVSKLKNLKR